MCVVSVCMVCECLFVCVSPFAVCVWYVCGMCVFLCVFFSGECVCVCESVCVVSVCVFGV